MTAPTEAGAGVARVKAAWTTPYYGVQHYPANQGVRPNAFSATVCAYESVAIAHVRTPGCGFETIESTHDTAEQARAHAEAHLFELTRGAMGAQP